MSQKTVAQLHAEIASQLPTNAANQITASDVRGVLDDMVDSSGNLSDGTPATLYSGNGTISGTRTVNCGGNALNIQSYSSVDIISDPATVSNYSELTLNTNGFDFESFDGTDGSSISATGGAMLVTAKTLNIVGKTGGTMAIRGPSIQICNSTSQSVAFLGATPIAQTANANQAVATDPASVITLANALRQEMIDRGFWKGSA